MTANLRLATEIRKRIEKLTGKLIVTVKGSFDFVLHHSESDLCYNFTMTCSFVSLGRRMNAMMGLHLHSYSHCLILEKNILMMTLEFNFFFY